MARCLPLCLRVAVPAAVPFESNRLLTSQRRQLSVAAGRIGSTSGSFVVGRGVEEPRARAGPGMGRVGGRQCQALRVRLMCDAAQGLRLLGPHLSLATPARAAVPQ